MRNYITNFVEISDIMSIYNNMVKKCFGGKHV